MVRDYLAFVLTFLSIFDTILIMKTAITTMLEQSTQDCLDTVNAAMARLNGATDEYTKRFNQNVINDLVERFGQFLSDALGDKINSQNNHTLNLRRIKTEYAHHYNAATGGKKPLDEYFKDYAANYSGTVFSHITTGKKFGHAYYTPSGKLYTKFLKNKDLFFMLEQEHVNLIKNKAKRECARTFLLFRDRFIKQYNELQEILLIKVNTKVDSVSVVDVDLANTFKEHPFKRFDECTDSMSYKSINNKMTEIIQDVIIHPNKTIDTSKELSGLVFKTLANISLTGCDSKTKIPQIFAQVTLKDNGNNCPVESSLDEALNTDRTTPYVLGNMSAGSYSSSRSISLDHILEAYDATKPGSYERYGGFITGYGNVILEIDKVMNNPAVKERLERVCKFWETVNKTWKYITQKHMKLKFINGVF